MLRRALLWMLASGLICSLPVSLEAAGRGSENANKPPEIANPFRGTVTNITPLSVTVKGDGKVADAKNASADGKVKIRFPLKADTAIKRDGKTITAAEIQKDDLIQVAYNAKPGSVLRQVTEIKVGNLGEDKPADKGGGKKKKK
jgi:hypothetical protein